MRVRIYTLDLYMYIVIYLQYIHAKFIHSCAHSSLFSVCVGFHHFYLGDFSTGILYVITLGGLGIGWLVDAVRIPYLVKRYNNSLLRSREKSEAEMAEIDEEEEEVLGAKLHKLMGQTSTYFMSQF